MTSDATKNLQSSYNLINLPAQIKSGDTVKANYTYHSDGTKAAAYTTANAGTVLEADDYYPLGGPLPTGSSTTLQPEKYQGKEWNPAASFNVYDFCAGNQMKFEDPNGAYFTPGSIPSIQKKAFE